jgi:hypothetical protein
VAIIVGWLPLMYGCGYEIVGHFPMGESLMLGPAMFVLLLAAWSRYLGTRRGGSRKASFTALLLTAAACLFAVGAFWFGEDLYIAGARARLQRDVDPEKLRQWALGMLPEAPPKKGTPLHLPNGETINADEWFPFDEKGGFIFSLRHFPVHADLPFHQRVAFHAIYDPSPNKRYAEVGCIGERFGLVIVIGPTNFIYVPYQLHSPAVKWADGMYVYVWSGG